MYVYNIHVSYDVPGYASKVGQSNGIGAARVTGKEASRGKVESVRKGQSHASVSSKTAVRVVKKSKGLRKQLSR